MITPRRLILVSGTISVLAAATIGAIVLSSTVNVGGGADGSRIAGEDAAIAPLPAQQNGRAVPFEDADKSPALSVMSSPEVLQSNGLPDGPEDTTFAQLLDRKIVQSASIDVQVEEVGRSFQEVIRFAQTAGGFVASSTFSQEDGRQVADLTIRVPATQYQDVLARIRGLGEVTNEQAEASDVTEEYTDLQARLRTLEATERRYLDLLAQAKTVDEILLVQDRLDQVRLQIEQVQGRINLLDQLTDLATITVHLRPLAAGAAPDGGGIDPLEAAAHAWERSLAALRGLAAGALVVAVFSWWIVPPLALAALVARWWLRGRPERSVGAPST